MVIVNCEICNKEIEKYQSQIDNSKSKKFYCSKECRAIYKANQVRKEQFICVYCYNIFYKTHREIKNAIKNGQNIKYCCRECMLKDKHVESKTVKCNECEKNMIYMFITLLNYLKFAMNITWI